MLQAMIAQGRIVGLFTPVTRRALYPAREKSYPLSFFLSLMQCSALCICTPDICLLEWYHGHEPLPPGLHSVPCPGLSGYNSVSEDETSTLIDGYFIIVLQHQGDDPSHSRASNARALCTILLQKGTITPFSLPPLTWHPTSMPCRIYLTTPERKIWHRNRSILVQTIRTSLRVSLSPVYASSVITQSYN